MIRIVYDSFILELSMSISISTALLFCYDGDNVKCGFLSKNLFKKNDNMAVEKISQ